ncbi:hypothetical protein D7X98_14505 [bacterium 1XD8-76]|nr:hypothetical protein D7X98_14505 [bacterium 1XD8-76]
MKVRGKKLFAVLCAVVMMCGSVGMAVSAEEKVEKLIVSEYRELAGDNIGHGLYDIPDNSGAKAAMLTNCSIGISVSASGVEGSIKTGSTVTASKIGVKNIRVEKLVDGKWTLVGTHSGDYTTNDNAHGMNVYTSSAQKGVQYRISCTHYAVLDGVTRELYNVTNGVSY